MNIEKFIEEYGIVQKYKVDFIDNLNEYTNMMACTIFYCEEDFDFKLLELHKGKKYIFIDNINQYNRIRSKTSINKFLCNDNTIFNYLRNRTSDYIFLKSKITNITDINVIDDKKIIFLINASLQEKYSHRYDNLIEKLDNFKYEYYIVICKKGKSGIEGKTLYIDMDDHYENLPKKIYEGIKYIYHNTDYNYIYKVETF